MPFIDLQLHTTWSDGTWEPRDLVHHLEAHHFSVAAITDHDRVDTAPQRLSTRVRLLTAAELTTTWEGRLTDLLAYGFAPDDPGLRSLTSDLLARQRSLTQQAGAGLEDLEGILALPSSQQPPELHSRGRQSSFAATDIDRAVAAVHGAGGVVLLAHPGRDAFDRERLDRLRARVPLDGLEAHYPQHTPEQTELFLAYAHEHGLLVSAGSDSHGPQSPPIPYPAELCGALLRRLGL